MNPAVRTALASDRAVCVYASPYAPTLMVSCPPGFPAARNRSMAFAASSKYDCTSASGSSHAGSRRGMPAEMNDMPSCNPVIRASGFQDLIMARRTLTSVSGCLVVFIAISIPVAASNSVVHITSGLLDATFRNASRSAWTKSLASTWIITMRVLRSGTTDASKLNVRGNTGMK